MVESEAIFKTSKSQGELNEMFRVRKQIKKPE